MSKITVYDAVMGSSKTNGFIDKINESPYNQKFIYITPLLSECHRIAGTTYQQDDRYKRPILIDNSNGFSFINGRNGYKYDLKHKIADRKFKLPDYICGNKADHLCKLIEDRENISSTHQLFLTLERRHLKNVSDYILIIDEAISVFNYYTEISVAETKTLIKKEILFVDSDGVTLRFRRGNFGRNHQSTEGTKYDELANLCDNGSLSIIDNSYIIWSLNIDLLLSFKEVWIGTYLFEGSQMCSLLKSSGVSYKTIKFGKKPKEFKGLINVIGMDNTNEKINLIGKENTSLSVSDFKRNKDEILPVLKRNLDNFNRHKTKSRKKQRYFTTFKDYSSDISGRKYKNEWLPFNIKATNSYSECNTIAYLMNLFMQPAIKRLCQKKGFPVNEDNWSLSEMLQWIWRSSIRNGNEITVYVPSSRMRSLLINWLNSN